MVTRSGLSQSVSFFISPHLSTLRRALLLVVILSRGLSVCFRDLVLFELVSIQEDTKCRLQAGHSCYYSVQTLLSSRLISKNLKIKIHKTIIFIVVLFGCET